MRLESDLSIWSSVEDLSGRDKGRIYAQRANYVVGTALNNPGEYERLFRNGRVRRKTLAGDIGCDRSALYDNPQIKALLDQVEGRGEVSESAVVVASPATTNEAPPLLPCVHLLLDRLGQGFEVAAGEFLDRIVLTDRSCRIGGQTYELPTIILGGSIQPEASDYLRYLIATKAVEVSSAKQYAKVLRAFLRYCQQKRRDWCNVDDQFLATWRDSRRGKIDDVQVVSDLGTVFQFYVWAEDQNYLSYHVGIYEKSELPKDFNKRDFLISARRKKASKSGGRSGWASTLTFRVSKAIEGRRNTPNDEQVTRVHEELLKATHGERDALIAAWAEEAGPRRAEILQIRRSDLPTNEQLAALIASEEKFEIKIGHRKRRNKAPLSANPYLLMATLDWIDGGRQHIVEDCRGKIKRYRDPDEIFISSKTGKVLTPDAVTKIMGAAFKAAGVNNASLHRLRAKAIVEELEKHIDAYWELGIVIEPGSQWAETVLSRVAEMAGHGSPASLRAYLNFVLARRVSLTDAARRKRMAEETRHLQRQLLALKNELEQNTAIAAAARLARRGEFEAADNLLRHAMAEGRLWKVIKEPQQLH